MFFQSLSLQNFRSYQQKTFNFAGQTTLIVGPNASGKTNLLEAIYLLARGKSFRADLEREVISYREEISRVVGVANFASSLNLEIILTTGEVQGKRTAGKIFKVNGVGRRWRDFVGNLKVVLFRPEDSEIVLGSPSIRRDYLDSVLEQVDPLYRQCKLVYDKGLRQRNKLLDFIRDGKAKKTQLEYWNRLLIKNGEIISNKREEMLQFYNKTIEQLSNPPATLCVAMRAGETMKQFSHLTIEYDKSAISPERLAKYAEAEVALGATLVGPHRDEIKLKIESSTHSTSHSTLRDEPSGSDSKSSGLMLSEVEASKLKVKRDLALFGSRGEQRMAVLALKMAELAFINQKAAEQPILLLDDIFSELDEAHRGEVLSLINQQQTIITTTETDLVPRKFLGKMEKIEI